MFGDSLPIIMTEKDAVKCRLLNPELIHQDFWYLKVEAMLEGDVTKRILDKIRNVDR
jgi:tetraacyldisaccharide 4'-kinase